MKTEYRFGGNRAIPLVVNLLCLFLACFLQSRSFVIGYTLSIVCILLYSQGLKINRKMLFVSGVSVTILFIVLTLCFKTDSSLGRMLIYKISLKMLREHYAAGIGLGNFAMIYGDYQSEYFRNGEYSVKELLLADNTKHAFNDYMQFAIETGISGVAFLSTGLIVLARSVTGYFKKRLHPPTLFTVAVSQIIALGTAAMFMHVFEKTLFKIVFVSACIIVFYYRYFWKQKLCHCVIAILIAAGGTIYLDYGCYLKNYCSYKQFKNAGTLFRTGYVKEAFTEYKALYPALNSDVRYLNEYATILTTLGHYKEAEWIMEHAVGKDNSSMFHNKLAECYLIAGKYAKAETAFQRAIFMVPNRFGTRFNLFKLYMTTRQYQKALPVGKAIKELPVKVPSFQVQYIKETVAHDLNLITKE